MSAIGPSTWVSLGTLVSVVIVAIKITRMFTTIELKLDLMKDLPGKVAAIESTLDRMKDLPNKVEQLEHEVLLLSDDMNNLWAQQRGGAPEVTRRAIRRLGEHRG